MIRAFAFVAVMIALTNMTVAQSTSATMSETFVVQLDSAGPMVDTYTIDCSSLAFTSDEAAERFFKSLQDNLVQFEFDAASQTATMRLSLPYVADKGWGVAEWNNYFNSTAERYGRMFEAFN